jgi:hypothetical protein
MPESRKKSHADSFGSAQERGCGRRTRNISRHIQGDVNSTISSMNNTIVSLLCFRNDAEEGHHVAPFRYCFHSAYHIVVIFQLLTRAEASGRVVTATAMAEYHKLIGKVAHAVNT